MTMAYTFLKSLRLLRVDLISEYSITEQYHHKLNRCWMLNHGSVSINSKILIGPNWTTNHLKDYNTAALFPNDINAVFEKFG